ATVQRLHALLNQRGQLKATAHLVDNGFFLQFIQHFSPFELTSNDGEHFRSEANCAYLVPKVLFWTATMPTIGENSPKYSDPETCSVYGATDNYSGPCPRVFLYDEEASPRYDITIIRLPAGKQRKLKPAGRLTVTPPSLSSLPEKPFPALRILDRTARHPAQRRRPCQ